VANSKALFFVNDQEANFLILNPSGEKAMSPDDDIDLTISQAFKRFPYFSGGL
jgi:hypothetical protein